MAKAHDSESPTEKTQTELPTDAADIDAEIAYCERRVELLRAAQKTGGVKQEYPRYVYKEVAKEATNEAPAVYESHLVESEEDLKKIGAGWGDHPAASGDKSAKSGDGNVSDVAAYVASVSDVDTLKALKAQERKGKARQGVYDAIDARLADLKERA